MSAPSSPPGLGVTASTFVPAAPPPGLSSPTAAANIGARPFVPSGNGVDAAVVNARPFVPASASSPAAAKAVASGAIHAPIFVPGGTSSSNGRPGGVDAKPFVPGASASATLQALKTPAGAAPLASAAAKPPKPSPTRPARLPGGRQAPQAAGRGGTPDLPDGDDLLGMSAMTPGDPKDVATQAAEIFKSLHPFGQQAQQQAQQQQQTQQQQQQQSPSLQQALQLSGVATGGRGRSNSASNSTRNSPRPGAALGPPPPGFGPFTALSGGAPGGSAPGPTTANNNSSSSRDFAGGRGAGASSSSNSAAATTRGGRGGGGRGRRPGGSRPSSAFTTAPGRMQKAGLFVSEQVRAEVQQRSYLIAAQVHPEAEGEQAVPQMVGSYHTLYPLEDLAAAAEGSSQALGVTSQIAKAVSGVDGQAYALRRIDGRQVIPTAELLAAAEACVARWEGCANHPNLVGLREALVSNEWGSPSLVFAHDYHPGAFTLEQAHILPAQGPQGLVRTPASEEQLWSYLVQLASGLRCIHSAGLAARPACLQPSKVLLCVAGRVRIGALGLPEVLAEAPGFQDVAQLQRDDLAALGNLLLLLACVGRGAPPSLEYLTAQFSRELCHVVAGLLASAEGSGFASWRSLLSALGDRVVEELDTAAQYSDGLMGEVQREAENGRLLRLLMKLNYICERPELGGDSQWAETGDRYLLKLFRDLLFHQVDEQGGPMLDWGLAAEALNKVDAGVPEKVLLMSRDEMSMLVVSYADVRRCIASCYEELRARAAGKQQQGGMQRSRSRASVQQQY
ncbi:hypothetical protein D9Q98_003340 [Chlorella vulgaris]|uniref:Protein kinase domain-containing protein n=1 Tax=Chlorella vulgaris TaxID=3077 RepID=A0A9D4TST5_CHLVU|nr:hypothetical protein D9Q98_003340 [Chlorella vulgaris]